MGIGVNVDWAAADFPLGAGGVDDQPARALGRSRRSTARRSWAAWLTGLEPRYEALLDGRFDAGAWSARQLTTGREVEVDPGVGAGRSGARRGSRDGCAAAAGRWSADWRSTPATSRAARIIRLIVRAAGVTGPAGVTDRLPRCSGGEGSAAVRRARVPFDADRPAVEAARRDPRAFEPLYRKYVAQVYSFAALRDPRPSRRRGPDRAGVPARAAPALPRFDERGDGERSARSASGCSRSPATRSPTSGAATAASRGAARRRGLRSSRADDPAAAAVERDEVERAWQAIDRLPEDRRQALVLRFVEEMRRARDRRGHGPLRGRGACAHPPRAASRGSDDRRPPGRLVTLGWRSHEAEEALQVDVYLETCSRPTTARRRRSIDAGRRTRSAPSAVRHDSWLTRLLRFHPSFRFEERAGRPPARGGRRSRPGCRAVAGHDPDLSGAVRDRVEAREQDRRRVLVGGAIASGVSLAVPHSRLAGVAPPRSAFGRATRAAHRSRRPYEGVPDADQAAVPAAPRRRSRRTCGRGAPTAARCSTTSSSRRTCACARGAATTSGCASMRASRTSSTRTASRSMTRAWSRSTRSGSSTRSPIPSGWSRHAPRPACATPRSGGSGGSAGHEVAICAMDFAFMGGSMGSVVGEKVTRAAEDALDERVPLSSWSAPRAARGCRRARWRSCSWPRPVPRWRAWPRPACRTSAS